jgi:UDP-N-acetylmuramate dehydrogenase
VQIQQNVPLAPLTTLKVGGPASYFTEATTTEDVRAAFHEARMRNWQIFVLGGGSNLVVADVGWPGLVLKIALRGVERHRIRESNSTRRDDDKIVFEAGAGEEWDALVALAVRENCAGVECMSGIPGTVGGTPVQNVGAYGQEVSSTISEVLVLDLHNGEVRTLCGDACGFGYRTSIFNSSEKGRYIVLRVSFALQPGGQPHIEYADLKKFFAGRAETPTLQETRDAVRQIRHSKAMLIVEGDEDARSAGSFFKNPLISEAEYERLQGVASGRGLQAPRFTTAEGVKVPAAWLVEQAGFSKGYTRGAVGISRKHALAIVNRGGATAAEVVALKEDIQKRVEEVWGIALQTEPVFVGF